MKVLSIIDSFKGSITSKDLTTITKKVLKKHDVEIVPIADGGDGFIDCFQSILKNDCKVKTIKVNNPIRKTVKAKYLVCDKSNTAYIELAQSSGINLLKTEELNPFIATTYGMGEVIKDAINSGYKNIVIGIGGSATNDGGVGILEAMGVKFYNNDIILNNLSNKDLNLITRIDDGEFLKLIKGISFKVLSDVSNPLLGRSGATYVFSRQKGSKESDLESLEANLKHFASFKSEYIESFGAGAAGGVGYCLRSYFNSTFYSGIDYILDLINYDEIVKNYDYVITGEGKIDNQSLSGKVIFRISKRTKNAKVILVCAINELINIDLKEYNIDSIYSVVNNLTTMDKSLKHPKYYFKKLVKTIKL